MREVLRIFKVKFLVAFPSSCLVKFWHSSGAVPVQPGATRETRHGNYGLIQLVSRTEFPSDCLKCIDTLPFLKVRQLIKTS
jgi:hypothetical protein